MPIRNPQALRQAYETLHLRSSSSIETNNEELEQQKTNIKLEKNVLGNKDFKEENDTSFNELDLRDSSEVSFSIPSQLENISQFNLMINTTSFGEMNMSTIDKYMQFLRNKCETENIFYCYNRVEKFMRNANPTDKKLYPIRFNEYPWSKNDETLLYKLDDFIQIFTKQPMFKKAVKLGPMNILK